MSYQNGGIFGITTKLHAFTRLMATLEAAETLAQARTECVGKDLDLIKSDDRAHAAFKWVLGEYVKLKGWSDE